MMRRDSTWLAAAAAGWLVLGWAATAAAQGGGSIQGVVTTRARALPPIRVTFDQKVCGVELPDRAIVVSAAGGLANAVVTLTGVKTTSSPREVMVLNDRCAFVPRVQVVGPNGTVKTSSKDPVLHTTVVQQADGRQLFNVAVPIPGIEIAKPLVAAGVLRVGCSTHQWMRGWIIVTDEVSAVTGDDGAFTLRDVPAGSYELRVWHEALKAAPAKITVVAGKPAQVTFEMK